LGLPPLIYANPGFGFIGPDAGPGKFRLRSGFGDVPVRFDPITKAGTHLTRENTYYPIQDPATGLWYPAAPNQVWRFWSETEIGLVVTSVPKVPIWKTCVFNALCADRRNNTLI